MPARYGVVADVHANLVALERVLELLRREQVDRYLCLGDVVGYGPDPNACVDRLAELGALVVAGNHDLMAIGRLAPAGPERVRDSVRWTAAALSPTTRERLESLPLEASPEPAVVMTHAALGDPARYVTSPAQARAQLRRLEEEWPAASILLTGHTHAALAFGERAGTRSYLGTGELRLGAERTLVNPGAVGQSRERRPLARAAVLDTRAGTVRFLAARYADEELPPRLRAAGLAPDNHHLPPAAWRIAPARRLRRRLTERRGG